MKNKNKKADSAHTALIGRANGQPAVVAVKKLLGDVRALIEGARGQVAQAVNAGLVTLYWNIGRRIGQNVLGRQLTTEYGLGFSDKNLRHMIRFAESFRDCEIVYALRRQLTWTHFRRLIYIEDPLKRDFYVEMCRIEGWNTRTLEKKIGGMLFERTAWSKKPEKLARMELKKLREEDRLTPDLVFRDPYLLDFLGLKGAYQEKDVEAAILREMEAFILELGVGFTFVARQKRVQVDGDDFYLDLLFYHRRLKRLVAIELKLDEFKPEFKGQMELYLRWLQKHECQPDENPAIGLILCAGKKYEQIELLELDKSGIHVAQYFTDLLPRAVLEKKLRDAIQLAREQLAAGEDRGKAGWENDKVGKYEKRKNAGIV